MWLVPSVPCKLANPSIMAVACDAAHPFVSIVDQWGRRGNRVAECNGCLARHGHPGWCLDVSAAIMVGPS